MSGFKLATSNVASVSASGSAPSSSLRSDVTVDLPLSPEGDMEVARLCLLRYQGELDDWLCGLGGPWREVKKS